MKSTNYDFRFLSYITFFIRCGGALKLHPISLMKGGRRDEHEEDDNSSRTMLLFSGTICSRTMCSIWTTSRNVGEVCDHMMNYIRRLRICIRCFPGLKCAYLI
ncbi:hypothetical protein AKJ16_DCAP02090 [Drosera capensis]